MLAHFAMWNGVLLGQAEAQALAAGTHPLTFYPEEELCYLPLDGINSPEFDFANGPSLSITGTRLGTSEPPVEAFWNYEDAVIAALTAFHVYSNSVNDSITGSDGLTATATLSPTMADTGTVSDSLAAGAILSSTASDSVTASDSNAGAALMLFQTAELVAVSSDNYFSPSCCLTGKCYHSVHRLSRPVD